MKKLIITEKPSVAGDFIKILEKDYKRANGYYEGETYVITWCIGHLVTLSYPEAYGEEYAKWEMDTLPFIPEKYKYTVIKDVKEQFLVVKDCLNREDIDTIYYAGDAAREGEYIQRLVRQAAGRNQNAAEYRVWIDSQTEDEIKRGIREAKPLTAYDTMADSGYTRAIEDYLVGINFSRALSIKYGNSFNNLSKNAKYIPISTGRVMTCVLGMIVDRERSIRNAVKIPFYGLEAVLPGEIKAKWECNANSRFNGSDLLFSQTAFTKREDAENFKNSLTGKSLYAKEVKKEKERKYAPLLYNLAELQNDCSRIFKISPDETLQVVQALYDKKMTTYPRTDARVLSSAIASEIGKNLNGLKVFDKYADTVQNILNDGSYKNIANTRYTDDSKVSDHYAIIPTGQALGQYSSLSPLEKDVYCLIIKRFLSVFLPCAEYDKTSVTFTVESEIFTCSGKKMVSPGYLALYDKEEEEEISLGQIQEGNSYNAEYAVSEGFTSVPKRYNSGNIILAMENAGNLIEDEELRAQIKSSGIGTSATRAETIKKLEKNGYILLEKKTQILKPSMSGEILYEIVKATVPSLLNPAMTASWEKGLSAVAGGTVTKAEYLDKINSYVRTEIDKIKNNNVMDDIRSSTKELRKVYTDMGDMETNTCNNTGITCPVCGKPVKKYDWGYGCTGYKEGCKFSISRKQYGTELKDSQLVKLVTKGKVEGITFHSAKKNKDYEAGLTFDKETGNVTMFFNNDRKDKKTD